MPRSARRIASWVGTLAAAALIVGAYGLVPGAGGTACEVRWLLARDRITPPQYRRAAWLLLVHAPDGASRAAVCRQLVDDPDTRVADGITKIIVDEAVAGTWSPEQLRALGESRRVHAALCDRLGGRGLPDGYNQALMREAFGPDWREDCARSGSTRP
jgi:hypothetical protein